MIVPVTLPASMPRDPAILAGADALACAVARAGIRVRRHSSLWSETESLTLWRPAGFETALIRLSRHARPDPHATPLVDLEIRYDRGQDWRDALPWIERRFALRTPFAPGARAA